MARVHTMELLLSFNIFLNLECQVVIIQQPTGAQCSNTNQIYQTKEATKKQIKILGQFPCTNEDKLFNNQKSTPQATS